MYCLKFVLFSYARTVLAGGTPHVISFEGQPIVGTLDLKSRVWNVKSIPLASKELLAFGLRDPDPGKFALLDQVG